MNKSVKNGLVQKILEAFYGYLITDLKRDDKNSKKEAPQYASA